MQQGVGWTEGGGSPLHAWLFFLGFLLFPVWWIAGFLVQIPKTRRLGEGVGTEKGVVLDDPQVEFGEFSYKILLVDMWILILTFRCAIMAYKVQDNGWRFADYLCPIYRPRRHLCASVTRTTSLKTILHSLRISKTSYIASQSHQHYHHHNLRITSILFALDTSMHNRPCITSHHTAPPSPRR